MAIRWQGSDEVLEVLPNHKLWEWPYLKGIFRQLKAEDLQEYRVVVTDHQTELPNPDSQTVVCYLSNEDGRIPAYTNKVAAVFTPYPPANPPVNVYTIPLGPGIWPEQNKIPFLDKRPIDICFAGRKLIRRKAALDAMDVLAQNERVQSFIRKTKSFGEGLSPADYINLLRSSKIAIAPEGNFSNITFRHYEAVLAGCVVISAPLPDEWCYQQFPGFQIENWTELPTLVEQLLNQPAYLNYLQHKTIAYYRSVWSPSAVASFIEECLRHS